MIYVNQLNSFDENIQFTFEIEEENNLAFLELMVIGNAKDTINHIQDGGRPKRPPYELFLCTFYKRKD